MKKINKVLIISFISMLTTACQTTLLSNEELEDPTLLKEYKVGDSVQNITNIRYNTNGTKFTTINYQSSNLVPVCSDFTIDSISTKNITLKDKNNKVYNYVWGGHSRKAGQSLSEHFLLHFGDKCDKNKISSFTEDEQYGIEQGKAIIGMSKESVIFAMGHPPIHKTPRLKSDYWLYWRTKFGKTGITFDRDDKVSNIR